MAIKLGELLLQENLITPEQLDEALKNQTLFGIKLGSSLVELGFITDEQLCRLLSSKLGVPAATSRALASVSAEVLAQVPAELAGKYRVVPIRLDGKKLALAMADPTDFKATDDVAFVTGYIVLPHIAPDISITSALSKYYQVRGDIRYLMAEGELDKKRRSAPAQKSEIKAGNIVVPMVDKDGELHSIEFPLEFDGFASLPGYEEDLATPSEGAQRYSVDQLMNEFSNAKERDQIGSALIRYLNQDYTATALFIIRNNMATGWCGISEGVRIEGLENLTIPLNAPSVMKVVHESGQFFMGSLVQIPEHIRLIKILRVDFRAMFLLLPIIMQKKVVAMLLVCGEVTVISKRLLELQKLALKASLAFETLIIKNKILQT
jgi:hypothetical protein